MNTTHVKTAGLAGLLSVSVVGLGFLGQGAAALERVPRATGAEATHVTLTVPTDALWGQPAVIVASVSPAAVGAVQLDVDGAPVGTAVHTTDGAAVLPVPSTVKAGHHQVIATFTPEDPTRPTVSSTAAPFVIKTTGLVNLHPRPGKKATHRERIRVQVVVEAPGGLAVAGHVDIYDGKKLVRSLDLSVNGHNYFHVRLPRLRPGMHTLSATLRGEFITPTTSKLRRLEVS